MVDQFMAANGASKVDLIGHSEGGISRLGGLPDSLSHLHLHLHLHLTLAAERAS